MNNFIHENEDIPGAEVPSNAETPSKIEITDVDIADIVALPEWQVREAISEWLVRDYVTNYAHGAAMPPIRLANVGGALFLIDGWHRLRAQQFLKRERVDAVVEAMTEDAARWQAAFANTTNGQRLKHREKRNVFNVFMKTGRYRKGRGVKSYREIARDLGGLASKSTIENWMKSGYPKIARRMASGRDFNAGPDNPLTAPTTPYERLTERVREAGRQAIAEARGLRCPVARLALAAEMEEAAKTIARAKVEAPQVVEDNPDF